MQYSGSDKANLAREKRPLERAEGDGSKDAMPEAKRQKVPALASVIVEAVKMDSLQKLCSSLEPLLRRVVGEEVERALAKLVPNRMEIRTPTKQIQGTNPSNLSLLFRNKLSLPLFTGGKVEGDHGLPIRVVLKDESTGQIVTTGIGSAAKLEVVVLDGDFGNDDEDWSQEDFERNVVKERDGKRPLLTGDSFITLKEGVGTLGELTFTDNSSWIRSRKFRLGVRVASAYSEGIRIRECMTEAFTVKDHRGELYKKHYPPALNDEVWRLDKIGKDGAFHKRLNERGIGTVVDFLRFYVMDRQNLRHILGSGMSNKMWEATVEHAKTCILSGKLYVFYADKSHNVGVIFNYIYELMGVISNSLYKSVDSLTDNEKIYVDKLVKVAYENWSSVMEYDGETLVSEEAHGSEGVYSQFGVSKTGGSMSGPSYNSEMVLSSPIMHFENASTISNLSNNTAGGATPQSYDYGSGTSRKYASQDQLARSIGVLSTGIDVSSQASLSGHQRDFVSGNEASITGLALGPPQSMISRAVDFQSAPLSQEVQTDSVDWARGRLQDPILPASHVDEYFIEEDLRARSLELLDSDDMQQLLRLQYPLNPENFYLQQSEDTHGFSGFTPSPSFGEEHARSSGKAYVGWLKLKAALRWGIFIRKIVAEKAEKRARLEELED